MAEYLTADDVAREMSISKRQAFRLMNKIGKINIGKGGRVSRTAFNHYVADATSDTLYNRLAAHTAPKANKQTGFTKCPRRPYNEGKEYAG